MYLHCCCVFFLFDFSARVILFRRESLLYWIFKVLSNFQFGRKKIQAWFWPSACNPACIAITHLHYTVRFLIVRCSVFFYQGHSTNEGNEETVWKDKWWPWRGSCSELQRTANKASGMQRSHEWPGPHEEMLCSHLPWLCVWGKPFGVNQHFVCSPWCDWMTCIPQWLTVLCLWSIITPGRFSQA